MLLRFLTRYGSESDAGRAARGAVQLGILMPLCNLAEKSCAGRQLLCIDMFYFYAQAQLLYSTLEFLLTLPTPNDARSLVIGFELKKRR